MSGGGAKAPSGDWGYKPLPSLPDSAEEPEDAGAMSPLDSPPPGQSTRTRAAPRQLSRYAHLCADFFRDNAGLLLIALSQGFTSIMGVFVKMLNALDPPVHPFEVGALGIIRVKLS